MRHLLTLALLGACKAPVAAPERGPEVRFRPTPTPSDPLAPTLLDRVPGSTWDRGLAHATTLLTASARDPSARITPEASAAALAAAGYPGHARFARELTGGGFPDHLVTQMTEAAMSRAQPVDVALARRNFSDGRVLWIGAVANRPALLDPLPLNLPLDGTLPVHVEALQELPDLTLFVAPPMGPVSSQPLSGQHALWLDSFHVPGEYRLEVVANQGADGQVLLLWSHFVDSAPPDVPPLPVGAPETVDPRQATDALYQALHDLRLDAGLPPVERFELFEPVAREHAALLAHAGRLTHARAGVTRGFGAMVNARFHPRTEVLEDLAAAPTWQEALDLVQLSPGHRRNLLCEDCTHASIGVALEPALQGIPRLFVAWEMLTFPNGEAVPIPDLDR